jgi:hypothetical protein
MERDFSKIIGDITDDPTDIYTPPLRLLTLPAYVRKSLSAVLPTADPLFAG